MVRVRPKAAIGPSSAVGDQDEEDPAPGPAPANRKRGCDDELIELIRENMALQRQTEEKRARREWTDFFLSLREWLTNKNNIIYS